MSLIYIKRELILMIPFSRKLDNIIDNERAEHA